MKDWEILLEREEKPINDYIKMEENSGNVKQPYKQPVSNSTVFIKMERTEEE